MTSITPLAILKKKAVLSSKPGDLALRVWIEVARKTIGQAEGCERSGNDEGAYIEWRKWAQIMDAVLKHPDYKSSMSAKNADYLAYQDLKQRFGSVVQHIRELETRLSSREAAAGLPSPANGTNASTPILPSSASLAASPSVSSSPPVPSTSKIDPPMSKRPISGGLASRMAALQNAGMSVSSPRVSAERSIPPHSAPAERPPEAPRIPSPPPDSLSLPINGMASSYSTSSTPSTPQPSSASFAVQQASRPRRPLPQTPATPTAVPPTADGEPVRMSSPLAPLESTSRPSSAPDVLSEPVASTSRLTLAIGVSPTSSQPSTASAFGYNFPSFSEFDSRFPEVPSHEPANGIPYNAPPPARADFGSGIKRSPALETLRSPPQESTGRFSEDGAASRPKHASNAVSGPNRSLPRTNFILPDALWAYLHPPSDDQPSVLLLDVRDRTDFERCRIRAAHTVCIEPITLRQEVPSQRLEASLVLSPDAERHAFLSRDRFDLVVIYDRSSTTIPSHAPSVTLQSTEDPARCLFNLQAAIFEREYHRSLRRPPVILVGGLEAWIRAVGTKGLDGSEAAEVGGQAAARSRSGTNGSIAEASARLEGADGRRGSVGSLSANEAKRTHRKASITPAGEVGYGQQPGLSRSVVDVLSGNPYGGPASTSNNYFARPPTALNGTSYIGSPIASPPIAAMPPLLSRSMSGSQSSTGYDYPQGYTSPPRQRAAIDYPQLAAHAVPQRPPLAAQANGAPTRPPPLMPHVQRLSSSTFGESGGGGGSGSPYGQGGSGNAASALAGLVNWGDGTVGMTGLKNLGNTCYMNSTLQCLSATIPLARFFKDGSYKRAINKVNPLGTRGALAETVAQLFGVLWSEQYNFVSPVTFRDAICRFAPQFQGTDQHDSQEFLAFLLDGLHEDLNFVQQKPAPIPYTPEREAELEMLPQQIGGEREWNVYLRRENSVIVAWFQGQYRSKLQCLTCSKTSTTYNNFMYLTLALPSHRGLGSHKVTLDSLLSAYVQEEVLDKDDAWNCPRCKVPRKASKKLSLSRLPPILIIHLKRFQFKGPFSDKIDTPVHFPLYGLDMGQFVAPPLPPAQAAQYAKLAPDAIPRPPPSNMYDLYAVSEQIGTLSSGHYTAHVRTRDRWCEIGDSKVRQCDEHDVRKSVKTAYILFYRRRQQ